ncbi:MAG: DUF488 domain-containing protein [bacterium]
MIFSIGHSNHSIDDFLNLLEMHQIQLLVDVRSSPYCKYATWFNKNNLIQKIEEKGMNYLYLGNKLGGFPQDTSYLKEDGKPDYKKMSQHKEYLETLEWLIEESQGIRTTIMCSEAEPQRCHRHMLITKSLLERGIEVTHILADGSLHKPNLDEFEEEPAQLSLFYEKRS